jgi:uncharacterized RDD family membrane protein YckC
LICPKCGAEVTGGAESCAQCGEPIPDPSSNSGSAATTRLAVPRAVYAGFWLRAIAYLIDSVILALVLGMFVLLPVLQNNHVAPNLRDMWTFYNGGSRQATAIALLFDLANWLYFASFESSKWQATPGKRVLNLSVTDMAGGRISFLRATGRHFAKFLSVLTFFFGFVMIGFTEKKQGLHDLIAGCLVVRKI